MQFHLFASLTGLVLSYFTASTQCSLASLISDSCAPVSDYLTHLDEFRSCREGGCFYICSQYFFFFSNKIFTESSKVCVHVMGSGWSETTESRAACTDEGREGGVLRCETSGVDVRAQWRLTVHYLSLDWSTVLLAEVNSAYFPPLELSLPKPPSLCTAPAVSIPTVSRANTDHGTSLKSMHQWFSL